MNQSEKKSAEEAKADDDGPGELKKLASAVLDAGSPVAKRMHAVFLLRQMGGKDAVEALAQGQCLPLVA